MKSGVPIVPAGMTGTENENVYGHMRMWKRTRVTLSVGKPFHLKENNDYQVLREETSQTMEVLADLLPESYRGNYK